MNINLVDICSAGHYSVTIFFFKMATRRHNKKLYQIICPKISTSTSFSTNLSLGIDLSGYFDDISNH